MRIGPHFAEFEIGRVPDGLANSSGKVGKYLMDTVGSPSLGRCPVESLPPHNEDGAAGLHMYTLGGYIRRQHAGKLGFARGYHIEFGGGRRMPDLDTGAELEWLTGGSIWATVQERLARYLRLVCPLQRSGEMIPMTLVLRDRPGGQDKWGIPVCDFIGNGRARDAPGPPHAKTSGK